MFDDSALPKKSEPKVRRTDWPAHLRLALVVIIVCVWTYVRRGGVF